MELMIKLIRWKVRRREEAQVEREGERILYYLADTVLKWPVLALACIDIANIIEVYYNPWLT